MNFLSANPTNHRRAIMLVVTLAWGVFMTLVVYKTPLTIREFIFPPVVGLVVFEFLFRTRERLRLVTLPLYILIVLLVSEILYGILYNVSFGSVWSPMATFQYLLSEFPYNLYALLDASIVTGLAYYLVKIYRNEAGAMMEHQPTQEVSNTPIFEEGPMTFEKWLNKNLQQVWGFVGWFVLATLIAPFSFGLITTPATVICLLAFGFSKQRKGVAGGILVAVSINFFISLVRGLQMNAWCFMPFYINMGFA